MSQGEDYDTDNSARELHYRPTSCDFSDTKIYNVYDTGSATDATLASVLVGSQRVNGLVAC